MDTNTAPDQANPNLRPCSRCGEDRARVQLVSVPSPCGTELELVCDAGCPQPIGLHPYLAERRRVAPWAR